MDFEVDRTDLTRCRTVDLPQPDLELSQVRLRVEAFALTANNLTYAHLGEVLSYWSAFPAAEPWGRIPAFGFAEVIESMHPEMAVGTRVYGYVPMSETFVATPGQTGPLGFSDRSPHRSRMAATYNRYTVAPRVDQTGTVADTDGLRMVLHPLFVTGFLIDDYLGDDDRVGADTTVITSASSRTAIATAWCLARRPGHRVVGLTSAARVDAVRSLGPYDQVIAYEDLAELAATPTALVDIAGGAALHVAIHEHLGDDLVASLSVGNTHVDDRMPIPTDLPGATAEFFFAPGQVGKRVKDWGREAFQQRVDDAWLAYASWAPSWIEICRSSGSDSLEAAYRALLTNQADPTKGMVFSLADGPERGST